MAISKSAFTEFGNAKTPVVGNLVPCVVNTLLGMTLLILGGLHGLVLVLDKVRAGKKITPIDVLNHAFDDLANRILFWVPFLAVAVALNVAAVISGWIPVIGGILALLIRLGGLVVSLFIYMLLPYALISVARDQTPWLDAWKAALTKVTSDVGGNGLYMLGTSILGGLGVVACCIGVLITLPMGLIAQIEGYEDAGGLTVEASTDSDGSGDGGTPADGDEAAGGGEEAAGE